MSAPRERTVTVNGQPCRVWEMGRGEPLGYLAGFAGLPRWPEVLTRLADHRRVIAPSLPGFPGAVGHTVLDNHLDWLLATQELLSKAGLAGADLMGASVGGALAADVAACWPGLVRRLILLAPLGLYDAALPMLDVFAVPPRALAQTLCAQPAVFQALTATPPGEPEAEWQIVQTRALEASARLLWPLGDTRLAKRLGRITAPTLILWGSADRVVAPELAKRFAEGISGKTRLQTIESAGHLADLDAPGAVAKAVLRFLGSGETRRPAPQRAKPAKRRSAASARKAAPRAKSGGTSERRGR
jgi:pimeloyl-ACP methyl ester carboxylesterase